MTSTLSRRRFLTSLLRTSALVGAAALLPSPPDSPTPTRKLWFFPSNRTAANFKDDTRYLQSLLDKGGYINLQNRVYHVSETLHLRRPYTVLTGAVMKSYPKGYVGLTRLIDADEKGLPGVVAIDNMSAWFPHA